MKNVRLTSLVKTSGCAAKLPAKDLHKVIDSLEVGRSDKLIEGFESSDDAFVYDLEDGRVMIETLDFFPPMVDDPYLFGQIAAANALSDIYAMGAEPAVAMNLMCFPSCLDLSVMKEILSGGLDKAKEAGCVIAGGHTISDPTPKYGLSVTGFCRKDNVWSNKGAREGDLIILTKKIGVGVVNTAAKFDEAPQQAVKDAHASMAQLNRRAYECARDLEVHAATDVTGFSLLGHLSEVADASGLTAVLSSSAVPLIEGALELARLGFLPEGAYMNREFLEGRLKMTSSIERERLDLLFDPQTSGGLLLFLDEQGAKDFLSRYGSPACIVGRMSAREDKLSVKVD